MRRAGFAAAIGLLLSYALLLATYWTARFGPGGAVDGDSVALTLAAQGVFDEGVLIPHSSVYAAGFGYPAVVATTAALSGLPVVTIQGLAALWLVVLALAALAAYRELNRSWSLGVLSVFLLLSMPDFVFYLLRGSHEKLTWTYGLLILYAVARSYRFLSDFSRFGVLVVLQYLLFLGMASTSVYFSSTLLFGFFACAAIGAILTFLTRLYTGRPVVGGHLVRFMLIAASCAVIIFLVMDYLYPPAAQSLLTFRHARDQLFALLFGAAAASEPYAALNFAWIGYEVYATLVVGELLVVLAAVSEWLLTARGVLRRGLDGLEPPDRLAFLLFAGYALQAGFGILLDFSGFLGLNLQVRLFPALAIVSAPLAARLIFRLGQTRLAARLARSPAAALTLVLLVCTLVLGGIFKTSNEPLLSNVWLFHLSSERLAYRWIDSRLERRTIWLDTWDQAGDALELDAGYGATRRNMYLTRPRLTSEASHVVISRATVLEAARRGAAVPATARHNLIYDNGWVRTYHRVPRTPYQE